MKLFDRVLEEINRGKQGLNVGLPHGIKGFEDYVPNIQQKTYYTIAGETASQKTALTDFMFMYTPFNWLMANKGKTDMKMKLVYWSFEISMEDKIAKGVCQKIFRDYGVLVDVDYILSRGKNRISDEVYRLVMNTRDYFDELHDIIEIHDVSTNPTGMTKRLEEIALENGHMEQTSKFSKTYRPKDPNLFFMTIVDHIKLLKPQSGLSKKELIDFTSNAMIEYRNKYLLSPIIVSQFNRSLASAQRELSTNSRPNYDKVKPQLSDLAESSAMAEDSNVVISIFSPNRYSIPEYFGYDITQLKDRVRFLDIMKNRNGSPNASKAVFALGEVGLFSDLPLPEKMDRAWYERVNSYRKVTN
jgi:hypothetical protein